MKDEGATSITRNEGLVAEENTEQKKSAEVTASNFLEALYGDPLRTETARTGRFLVIASAICIAVVLLMSASNPQVLFPLTSEATSTFSPCFSLLQFYCCY